jgi:hypothetical protein
MLANAVAEMVASLGYEPFIWDADMFGRQYKLVRVDPLGVLIDVPRDGGTVITVGVQFLPLDIAYGGGSKLDMANPKSSETILKELILQHC